MGQYYALGCINSQERIYPFDFDSGSKMWEWMANSGGTSALVAAIVKGGWGGELVFVGDYTDAETYGKITNFRKARVFTKRVLKLEKVYIVNHATREYIHIDKIYFDISMPRGTRKSTKGYTIDNGTLKPMISDEERLPTNEQHLLGGCLLLLIVWSDHSGGGDVNCGPMEGRWKKGNVQCVLTAPPQGYRNITEPTVECFLDAING